MLGLHTVDEICRGWDGKTWAGFAEHVTGQYLQGQARSGSAS